MIKRLKKIKPVTESVRAVKAFNLYFLNFFWNCLSALYRSKDYEHLVARKIDMLRNVNRGSIYFVGTNESQDMGSLVPELEKIFERVTLFCQADGTHGMYKLQGYNDLGNRKLNTEKFISDIEELIANGEPPDLILFQALGFKFDLKKMQEFRVKHDLIFVNISLDDKVAFFLSPFPFYFRETKGSLAFSKICDLTLVSNLNSSKWYRIFDVPAIYFPMASSPDVFYPIEINKIYDVGFIGNNYGFRSKLIGFLEQNNIRVKSFGTGWPAGYLSYKDANLFYNQCKIVLGIGTVGHCSRLLTSKLRDFDVTLSGAVYVTNYHEDLTNQFVKDEEIVLCKTKEEFRERISELLVDEIELSRIRKKARERSINSHTYSFRFGTLFQ